MKIEEKIKHGEIQRRKKEIDKQMAPSVKT